MAHARPVYRLRAGTLCAVLTAWAGAVVPASAETLYVTDRIQLGLHESRSHTSVVAELVPSGTALEALERDGGFVKVRTPGGSEGWMDAAYLTPDLPAEQVVKELEAWKATREEELAAAWAEVETLRDQLAAAGGEPPPANEEMRRDYLSAVDRIAALEAENAAMRELLERQAREATATDPPRAPVTAAGLPDWALQAVLGAAAVLFLGGTLAGTWLMDRLHRRRHGGFRV